MRRNSVCSFGFLLSFAIALAQDGRLPQPKSLNPSPWNGSWKLNVQRSSPVAAQPGVPQVYRFTLGSGAASDVPIKWEIPELREVVLGKTDNIPMLIKRAKSTPGLTLAVHKEGSSVLLYSVFRNATLVGGGRMMLVDNGVAWVDLTWPNDRQDLASELVYERQ